MYMDKQKRPNINLTLYLMMMQRPKFKVDLMKLMDSKIDHHSQLKLYLDEKIVDISL